jgi:hypothetical protein
VAKGTQLFESVLFVVNWDPEPIAIPTFIGGKNLCYLSKGIEQSNHFDPIATNISMPAPWLQLDMPLTVTRRARRFLHLSCLGSVRDIGT